MIRGLRIDHRLLHGQVAFSWAHYYSVSRIIIIDNKAAADEFQKMALSMAKPYGTKLNVFSVNKDLELAEKIDSLNDDIMIVFGNTTDASQYICEHPVYKELNLGGIPKKEDSIQYTNAVYLNKKEIQDLEKIQKTGCRIIMQQLPTSKLEELKL